MEYAASIIVPVFNTEEHLNKCLQSLIHQSYQNFEIVVVDDGSSGNSKPLVDHFRQSWPHIKHIRNPENLGTLRSRFIGVENSLGKYVGFLDSDDRAEANFIEALVATAQETGADIVSSSQLHNKARRRFVAEGAVDVLLAYGDNHNVWTKLYRKAFVLRLLELRKIAQSENISNAEDLLFNVFFALQNPRYVHIPDVLVLRDRKRKGSATNPESYSDVERIIRHSVRSYDLIIDATSHLEISAFDYLKGSMKYTYKVACRSGLENVSLAINTLENSKGRDLFLMAIALSAHSNSAKVKKEFALVKKRYARLQAAYSRLENKIANVQNKNNILENRIAAFKQNRRNIDLYSRSGLFRRLHKALLFFSASWRQNKSKK